MIEVPIDFFCRTMSVAASPMCASVVSALVSFVEVMVHHTDSRASRQAAGFALLVRPQASGGLIDSELRRKTFFRACFLFEFEANPPKVLDLLTTNLNLESMDCVFA